MGVTDEKPGGSAESLDKAEGDLGDLAPAVVDGEGMSALGYIDDLGDGIAVLGEVVVGQQLAHAQRGQLNLA